MDYKIFAIIVTYNPDNSVLDEFVRKITHQVSKVIIVDNSEPSQVNSYKDVDIVRLNDNVGIAEAQNIGLQKAMDENCDFIFTFDKDSQISDSYCKKMIAEYNKFKDQYPIACIGPTINQQSTDHQPKHLELAEKDFIISSGALFPLHAFQTVGMFKADWFIDMIDVEWSHRARKKGYLSFETPRVIMNHNIGENEYPKLFIWEVRIGSPVRQYYLVRNWIFSLKSKSFDMRSKLIIIFLLLKKIPLFAIMTPKRKRIKFILQGIWDGVIGKGGKYSY
ncbi:TPA: glycosyltransferase family 2 protein [Citrobacter freundii]|nr:glycosyltransferase family 2 protein [Citrobacter freundii]HBZ8818224.1 glycosyltransferase family 2 protein [Citrobacter freundii]HBZ8895867.1 glycosyltransferase family 2 protein [Citrobacter freundii]HBZ8951199.1 glycosyltransferase family 2 protein [Citrobacter freundii]HBZ9060892.1 glycosyltransferase family 2 protein [Citrobacter freundii]